MEEIKEIFDLNNLSYEFGVTGITDFIPYFMSSSRISTECINIFDSRGEFVGYISDPHLNVLHLFRDRVGGRNLYYWDGGGSSIVVSTDILWVLEKRKEYLINWEFEDLLDLEYIKGDYIEFQVPFDNRTIYKNIHKVMPGEIVSFPDRKRVKYWSLKFGERKFSWSDLLDLIKDAVNWRKRLLTEGRYTSYLSGGIDSSSVTILADPEESFSGFYEHEQYSELDYIKCLGRRFKPVKITEDLFYKFFSHLPDLIPDPMGGLGIIPQLIVAMEAFRGGYHYAFTGEGGDEVFTGYNWNTAIFQLAKAARDLKRDRYMVRYESMADAVLQEGFGPLVAGLIGRGYNKEYQVSRILSVWDKDQSVENNVFKINIEIGLPAILTVDERVGLYSGVIPVSPLVDHNIIEYVASINSEERSKIPKHIFREAMDGILPDKIRVRYDKMGFPLPAVEWKWPMIEDLVNSFQNRRLINLDPPRGFKIMDRMAWAICNLEMICRRLESE